MKAIVTGANGFVGKWLVKKLAVSCEKVYAVIKDENEDIACLDGLKNISVVYCDLCNINSLPEKIKDRDIECFYHLAWVGSAGILRSDYSVQLKNAEYSCDSAQAAKAIGCKKFLCAGTITENIADEILTLKNVSQNMMYGICKKTTHLLLEVLCKKIDLQLIWMQFSNIYGPGDSSGNLISYALGNIIKGERPVFSKGSQPYDFIYIEDLVSAAALLGENNVQSGNYFLGSGDCRLLCEHLKRIPAAIGSNCKLGIGERPEDGLTYCKEWFDISKLKEQTGFLPAYTFEDGIKITYDHMADNI